jgi:hypothetical protein
MGSGKSHAANQFTDQAHRIDGDHLFSTSHRVLRPGMPVSEKNDWDKWPRDKRDEATLRRAFSESLPRADDKVYAHRGHVIADGAIFVYDWFRLPLIAALQAIQPFQDVHLLYLNLTPQQLFENIHRRGKPKQMKQYDTVEKVARDNDGFRQKFGTSRRLWEEFEDYGEFEGRMRAILEP